jgi:enamine deaminase RidA (YjgF/YER057c/UK114 family)
MKPFILTLIVILFSPDMNAQNSNSMNSKIELLSPEGLHKNPAYSQVAVVEGNNRTIYIGGQNAVDKDGKLVGKGDIEAQAKQILQNLQTAAQAGGGSFENIIKWNIYIVQGQSTEKALKVFQGAMSKMKNPPLITGVFVSSLASPDFLLEIDAIAVVPLK